MIGPSEVRSLRNLPSACITQPRGSPSSTPFAMRSHSGKGVVTRAL
jgi:hypothetical protein